jgi:16S rRNA (cytidine1402-2'-O)-methyltransferase
MRANAAGDLRMGTLYFIATPIGNLEDLSLRALRILGEVDALACEDTRMTRRIFERHGITPPRTIFSHHEHNEAQAARRILGLLREDAAVAVCSDGGFPGISDPGYRVVREALEEGHTVDVIPGPSAVPTALLHSGLPTSSFTFKGFPPRKSGQRRRFLAMEAHLPHTLVLFESPFRIGALLDDALAALGNRDAAVCLELTKLHQRVVRGPLAEIAPQFRGTKVKGEITVVIAGNHPKFSHGDDTARDEEE